MRDFKSIVKNNLKIFPGIIDSPDVVSEIESLLYNAEHAGQYKLVDSFCSQNESDRALDFLLELWICRILVNDCRIKKLEYEPINQLNPPDFRFIIEDCHYDLQVKRLCQIKNELTIKRFHREFVKHLALIKKPWFIHYWVSDKIESRCQNLFFQYIKSNIMNFNTSDDFPDKIYNYRYSWEFEGKIVVRFSFTKKNIGNIGISPGCITDMGSENDTAVWLDNGSICRAIKRQLRKSSSTLKRNVSDTQSNLVIIKMDSDLFIGKDSALNALYGD